MNDHVVAFQVVAYRRLTDELLEVEGRVCQGTVRIGDRFLFECSFNTVDYRDDLNEVSVKETHLDSIRCVDLLVKDVHWYKGIKEVDAGHAVTLVVADNVGEGIKKMGMLIGHSVMRRPAPSP